VPRSSDITSAPVDPAVRAAKISGRHAVFAAVITAAITGLVGLAGVFVAFQTGKNKGAEAVPPATVTITVGETAGSTDTASPGGSSGAFEVHLKPNTGADVDTGKTQDGIASQGPSGALDVYFDSQALRVNGGKMYIDRGTDVGAEERCRAVTKSAEQAQPPSVAWQDNKFCFLTSDGNPAWMYVNAAEVNGLNKYVDLKVLVWR